MSVVEQEKDEAAQVCCHGSHSRFSCQDLCELQERQAFFNASGTERPVTYYDKYGKPTKRDPLSPKGAELLSRQPPQWYSDLFDMLKDVGVHIPSFKYQSFALALKEQVDDYPVEWIPKLRETIVANGVQKIDTVLEYIIASHKRQIPPGERPAKTNNSGQRIDDAYIEQWIANKLTQLCDPGCETCDPHRERLDATA